MFRELVRKHLRLPDEQVAQVLRTQKRGVLSVQGDDGYPYGMPMNFWYNEENGCIYFHSGKHGHKVDAIARDNKVSFCVYDEGYQKDGHWALYVSSVVVFGRMHVVEDFDRAMDICRQLSLKYTSDTDYIEAEIESFGKATLCYELRPEHVTGKLVKES